MNTKANAGYYLNKSGERVNDLLSRHFIVPTLSAPPDINTTQWQDGNYTVPFRIGEFVRVYSESSKDYIFFRLKDINEGKAVWVKDEPGGKTPSQDAVNPNNKITIDDNNSRGEYIDIRAEVDLTTGRHITLSLDESNLKDSIDEINTKISNLGTPGGVSGGVEIVTPEEYEEKKNNNEILSNVIYLLVIDNSPFELYIGNILIGKKGDLENIQFPYTFPITF